MDRIYVIAHFFLTNPSIGTLSAQIQFAGFDVDTLQIGRDFMHAIENQFT
jgi:hypothetical protein